MTGFASRVGLGVVLMATASAAGAQASLPPAAPIVRDLATIVQEEGLSESERPARELISGWKPRKVVVVGDGAPGRAEALQAAAPGIEVVTVRSSTEAVAHMADADGLINSCSPAVIKAARNLRWIQHMGAGIDPCIPSLRDRKDITLTNLQSVNSNALSDHVMAMTLAMMRGLDIYARQTRDGRLDRTAIPEGRMKQLRGQTMLVVGLGGIGTDVARKAHAFGMRVIATRNSGREGPDFVDYVGLADELPNLIAQADVVAMTAPLTPATTDLFNKAMFDRMKDGAIFLNIGRGGSVVQEDLVAALQSGKVGGAGLDVTDPEPLPAGHPLFTAPNVLLTPHIGGDTSGTPGGREESWVVVAENLRRYAAGERLYNLTDVARGY